MTPTPLLFAGYVGDFLVDRRITTIKNRVRDGDLKKAIKVLEDTSDMIEKRNRSESEDAIMDFIHEKMEMATMLCMCECGKEVTIEIMNECLEALRFKTPLNMTQRVMQRRMFNDGNDVGCLSELPADLRWYIGGMLV